MLADYSRRIALSLVTAASLGLAACSGGSSTAPLVSSPGAAPVAAKTAAKLGVTLAGVTSALAHGRQAFAVLGTPIAVTYNGATVATGTLDKDGFARLTFTQPVPAGATVVVTIGSGSNAIVASVPLVNAAPATAALFTYDPGPPASVNVARSEDNADNGHYDGAQGENENEDEDAQNGNVNGVNDTSDMMLPSNLPISLTACGNTLTIGLNANASPAPSGAYALEFQEKLGDDEVNSPVDYHVDPFTTPVTFAIVSNESRVRIDLTQNGKSVFKLKAPLGAVTQSSADGMSPTSCPTVTPTMAPSPSAAASAPPSPAATG
ncbi:MAG: hypothetical protein NVSMB19_09260 [Vulcanimicrobiaceae bacterium]